jgi:predicted secreted hydrolase
MNVRRALAALLIALLVLHPMTATAQGFAGLGTTAEGFAVPQPDPSFSFPRDHGAHPDFRIEWWYVTANLTAADGTAYGVQWTLFRSALAPPGIKSNASATTAWSDPQIWMGHAALTTPDRHFVAERLSRGGIGQAGVTASPFDAWIDDWRMQAATGRGGDAVSSVTLKAAGKDFGYALDLDATGPLVLQGQRGYSVKSAAGQASYYYSQPFYTVRGTLSLPGGEVAVTGQAWLDREWSSQPLAADQTGWDWFSLHFASGEKLMGFRLRDTGAGFTSATWISADGTPTPLPPGALSVTPGATATVAGRSVPVGWHLVLPSRNLDITTQAVNSQAWMATRTPYWEGPITVRGSHAGRGYLEMTGY